jgi:hypothetical protein
LIDREIGGERYGEIDRERGIEREKDEEKE